MGGTWEPATRVRRVFAAPVEVVFGVLSDTNRWDRLIGLSASTYTYELTDPQDPTSRTRIGHARLVGGFPVHFAEDGEYWAGTFLRGVRRFRGALGRLFRYGFLDLRCRARGDDTEVEMAVGARPTVLGWLVLPFTLLQMAIVLRLYLRSVRRVVAGANKQGGPGKPGPDPDAPAAARAKHALLVGTVDGRASGPRSQLGRAFADRAQAFAASPIAEALRERVLAHVRERPDDLVLGIHPLELAAAWGEGGRETVRAFLHATRAGLFDLEWEVDCPACKVATAVAGRLDEVRGRIHCDECDVSFDVDFAKHVHATFSVNAAVRRAPRVVYCATSPSFRPHVHGYVTIAPNATREIAALPDGEILLRARGSSRSATFERSSGSLAVEIDGVSISQVSAELPDGTLRVTNRTPHPVRLQVERAGWQAPRARGSLIVTIPGFTDLFGTDAPAAGFPMEIGRVAVLFTDLVGSVDLYHRIGDARAFGLVHEHWRDAFAAIAKHRGAVIKTLGDGVLAAFPEVPDAIAAALDMMAAAERLSRDHDVAFAIRAGCHEGPCFLVRANDRVDLFGSTVNLAARLSVVAGGQQLALLAEAAETARPVLARASCEIEPVTTQIRGLPGNYQLAVATRPSGKVLEGKRLTRMRTDPAMPAVRIESPKPSD